MSPILNFAQVDDRVDRGGQPQSAADWQWLYDQGIRSVVKLNEDSGFEGMPDEPWLQLSPNLFKNPISVTEQWLTEPDLQGLIDTVDYIQTHGQPMWSSKWPPGTVFVHCWHGQDRTGLVIALYRIATGWSIEAAWQEALDHDFHQYLVGLSKAFNDLAVRFQQARNAS